MNTLNLILLSASSGGEIFFYILVRIIIAYGIGLMGEKRKIGYRWAFTFSLILGAVIGLIIVLCSKKKDPDFIDMN